jgi:RNA polymerase sigma-70 factor (ECF subfamily)
LLSIDWQPVYWTIRTAWSVGDDAARDLTQAYFTAFLERDLVRRVDADRGRFRSYVKATLKNWILATRRDAATLKRGGGTRIVALDELGPRDREPESAVGSPERSFERKLMHALLARALGELERQCAAEGKRDHYALFLRFYGKESADSEPSYAALMAEFGLDRHGVKNRLSALRARYRNLVLELLRDGLSSDADLLGEIREVFS